METGSDKDLERLCTRPPYGVREQNWSGPGRRTIDAYEELKSLPVNERKISSLDEAKIGDHLDEQKKFIRRKKKIKEVEELLKQTFIKKQKRLEEFEKDIDEKLDASFYYNKFEEKVESIMQPKYWDAFKSTVYAIAEEKMKKEEAIKEYWIKPKIGSRRTFFNLLERLKKVY